MHCQPDFRDGSKALKTLLNNQSLASNAALARLVQMLRRGVNADQWRWLVETRNAVAFEGAAGHQSTCRESRSGWEMVCRFSKKAGPYLLVEAVMPGGTLLALALYLYRSRRAVAA